MNSIASHEAGFDALMTGYVFFRAMNILSTFFDKNQLEKPLKSLVNSSFHTNPSLMRNRVHFLIY